MHLESGRDLYSFYSLENKSDAYIAYLYLKHIDHFIHHVYASIGLEARTRTDNLGHTLDDILTAYVAQIAEAAPSLETNIYHGKVMTLKEAVKFVTLEKPLSLPPVNEHVLPFKIARDIIIENPTSIAVGECPCRAVSANPCLPEGKRDVCMMIGEPWVSFITEHNPKFRRLSQTEAVETLHAAHERGDVHAAYFKKEMGGRMFAICNCCDCCCIGVRMWNALDGAIPFLAPSGHVSKIADTCDNCGQCTADGACPFRCIHFDEASLRPAVDREKCMGCGVCERVCPRGAITLEREPARGQPLDLDELQRVLHVG